MPPRAVQVAAVREVDLVIDVIFGQFVRHVADREDMNARGDQRHHHEHDEREAVDVVIERDGEVFESGECVERAREVSRYVTAVGRFRGVP